MTDIYNLFNDLIQQPHDYTDCCWYEKEGAVYWNVDDDVHELVENDGETYSMEVYGREPTERDGYVFYTLYDGCGDKIQAIFDKSREIDIDVYWEEYNKVGDE